MTKKFNVLNLNQEIINFLLWYYFACDGIVQILWTIQIYCSKLREWTQFLILLIDPLLLEKFAKINIKVFFIYLFILTIQPFKLQMDGAPCYSGHDHCTEFRFLYNVSQYHAILQQMAKKFLLQCALIRNQPPTLLQASRPGVLDPRASRNRFDLDIE